MEKVVKKERLRKNWLLPELYKFSLIPSKEAKEIIKCLIENLLNQNQQKIASPQPKNTDIKGILAALTHLLECSCQLSLSSELFQKELLQLGLPKEHASLFSTLFAQNYQEIYQYFHSRNSFNEGQTLISCHSKEPGVLTLNLESESIDIHMNKETQYLLLSELKKIQSRLSELKS